VSPGKAIEIRTQGSRGAHALRVLLRGLQLAAAGLRAAARFAAGALSGPGPAGGRARRAAGRALTRACTELGATFVKVGQIASTRSDLLPGEVVDELRTLRDQVPAFSFEAVRATVERELGAPLQARFARFEPEPIAAASVAQVHRAVLPDGEIVAVKVRRPDVVERVHLDRSILVFAAAVLERLVPSLRLVSLREAIESFCDAVEAQLDLRLELAHAERFRDNFRDEASIRFPRPLPELSSQAVLTMEFVDGVREEDLEGAGIDVRGVVEAGMRGVCRMIFFHGFVHADLHPGNIRFRPPRQIVLYDLGLVGTLSEIDRLTNARLLFALATGDGATVARLFYEHAPHTHTPDYAAYEREIIEYVESVRRKGLRDLQVTLEIGRIFDILRRHRIQARSHMTMVNLAMMTAEGLGRRLAPELSLADEALPYLAEALGAAQPTTGLRETPSSSAWSPYLRMR
jgi:ubiquinone biosynthesis protein